MKKVDAKATIIKAIEKKSLLKPTSNLKGRDLRKSSCAYGEVIFLQLDQDVFSPVDKVHVLLMRQ